MAAPKNPNPGPGAKKRREQGDATAARRLRAAGWLVVPPPDPAKAADPAVSAKLAQWLRDSAHPKDTADTVGSLRATLATAEANSWDGWKQDEA